MNYGYFDKHNREYVITRPDTPTPWFNYLGSGGFSGIISNNAGGLSFYKDPSNMRVTRYKFDSLPVDRPGRYVYIKDMESGEYWSPTWQPVLKDLDDYECRHGMGYTKIKGVYSCIEADTTYFVPHGKDYEIWRMKIKNSSNRARKLKLFTYLEFSFYDAKYDMLCEWPRMCCTAEYNDRFILFNPHPFAYRPIYSYFGTDTQVESYDCHLDKFVGAYRSESNPIAVERGTCSNSEVSSDKCVGSLCCPVTLEAGEEREIIFVLGVSDKFETLREKGEKALDRTAIEQDLQTLKQRWADYFTNFTVSTPDEDINLMLNTWHQYQCKTTFDWSRFISLYERGVDRGWGFRDSMQDVLGVMHTVPDQVKARIKLLLSIQFKAGNAKAVYYPATGETAGDKRSDDHLWSVFSVCNYIRETGDIAFLDEIVSYVDEGEGTVLEHLVAGMNYSRTQIGTHGIPLMFRNDWNDSMAPINEKGGSESVFVFFQLGHAAYEMMLLTEQFDMKDTYKWASDVYDYCKSKMDTVWDGEWFLRAFNSKGEKFGTRDDSHARIFINPQSWAVLSRLPSNEQAISAFDNVRKYLNTDFGLMINFPGAPFYDTEHKGYFAFTAGTRENGGVFYHTNTWAVIAEALLKRNEYAFEYYKKTLPCGRNDISDLCMIEPYVYASSIMGKEHPAHGWGTNSWLTGTASWMFLAASQYILGIRPDYDGLVIDPCIPADWSGFDAERVYRGVRVKVKVINGKSNTVSELIVDGVKMEGNKIPLDYISGKEAITVTANV